MLEATQGLSQILTAQAAMGNATWPFFTLDNFEVWARHIRNMGNSEMVVFAPFVGRHQVAEWNAYSNVHQGWIDDGFAVYQGERPDANPIPSSIYRFGRYKGRTVLRPEESVELNENGERQDDDRTATLLRYPLAPFWQMSRPPFDTSIVNFNALSDPVYEDLYDRLQARQTWVLGTAGPNPLIDYTVSQEDHDALHTAVSRTYVKSSSGQTSSDSVDPVNAKEQNPNQAQPGFANHHPHTGLVYPVWETNAKQVDNLSNTATFLSTTPGDAVKMVGMLVNIIPWDMYLQHLLPDGVQGITCVLRNTAGQAFTYQLNGPEATYVGPDDLHDPEFAEYEFTVPFAFTTSTFEDEVDDDTEDLRYWLSVYPGQELRNAYSNRTPLAMALAVGVIFIAVALTFGVYDRKVVTKNNKILDAAADSNAILAVRIISFLS